MLAKGRVCVLAIAGKFSRELFVAAVGEYYITADLPHEVITVNIYRLCTTF